MKKLIEFKAAWCGPCKMIAPFLKEYEGKYNIEIKDVDEESDIAISHNIRTVPTVLIFDNDVEIARFIGAKEINKTNLDKHV